jgi:MYXO-CTERM domain-containing protein
MRTLLLAILACAQARTAAGFCGFYVGGADAKLFNNATLVVMMREGTRTVLGMQNNYQGPPDRFAMVVPVPVVLQKENVKTLPKEIFAKVDQLAAPRLVEYWEKDPCAPEVEYETRAKGARRVYAEAPMSARPDLGVKIEAQFTVAEYEIVILSAKDSTGLETWLHREKYTIPAGAEPILRPYVAAGSKFFVAKVDPTKVRFESGQALLSPLRFHYDSELFALPVRLGLLNSSGTQDLIVHILARGQRYEVANFPNATIPTNLDVREDAKERFGEFYAALFDATLEKHKRAVVTEYAWDSGSCDPCPGPTLDQADLATLGADALPGAERTPMGFVLTRLHARYGKDSLGEDLVFRAAPPISGGREVYQQALEKGAQPSSINNFQGRYAVRHPWTGPIACENPTRGRWGGPPGGPMPTPRAARDLAFAKRGAIQLASIVREEVPELGLKPSAPSATEPAPARPPAKEEPGRKSPGCRVGSTEGAGGSGALAAVGLLLALARRRRSAR